MIQNYLRPCGITMTAFRRLDDFGHRNPLTENQNARIIQISCKTPSIRIFTDDMETNPPVDARVQHFTVGYCWKDDNSFCRIRLVGDPTKHLGVDEMKELCNSVYEICEGKKHKHLIDARGVYGAVLPGAREELRNNEKMNACRSAAAIIVNSLANKLIMTFFIQFNKPPYPYRVFENPEEAVTWLNSL